MTSVRIIRRMSIGTALTHDDFETKSKMRWVPLEANPEIFQQWTTRLGLNVTDATFVDVYGLDPELLAFVPQPVYAVLMLFPVTDSYEIERKEMDKHQESSDLDNSMIFFKQTIDNACGTMGILHAVANSPVQIAKGTPLAQMLSECKNRSPAERSAYLETWKALEEAHTSAASGGQTSAPAAEDPVDLHFSAFVAADVDKQRCLIELDGRRPKPVNHGPIEGALLQSIARVIKHYMSISDSLQYSLIALTAPAES